MFGVYLIKVNAISKETLSEALEAQRFKPSRIGRILRDLGHLTRADLNRCLEGFLQPRVSKSIPELEGELSQRNVSAECLSFARERSVIPRIESDSRVSFLAGAFCDETIEAAELQFGRAVTLETVSRDGFLYLWNKTFEAHKADRVASNQIGTNDRPKAPRDSAYVALLRDLLERAHQQRASDVHVQPESDGIQVRLRINGELETVKRLGVEHRQGFLNESKRLCGFAIGESGVPQDRRLSLAGHAVDLRANLTPTQYGERIVLRLLDNAQSFRLDESGLADSVIRDLRSALRMKNGVLIVSGPTGSGKTTLLYRLLCDLDRATKNIVTLEDPIEYRIPGLSQTQVGPKVSFAQALRSILRQDPDVILVGEVRDRETADLCIQAALTGHLVLASLHANSASEVSSRFLSLGVDRERLGACLRFAVAQRLVSKLCTSCSQELPADKRSDIVNECKRFGVPVDSAEGFRVRNSSGCEHCRGGIVGRIPILEYIGGRELRASILGGPSMSQHISLREAAICQAEKGVVDVQDAFDME